MIFTNTRLELLFDYLFFIISATKHLPITLQQQPKRSRHHNGHYTIPKLNKHYISNIVNFWMMPHEGFVAYIFIFSAYCIVHFLHSTRKSVITCPILTPEVQNLSNWNACKHGLNNRWHLRIKILFYQDPRFYIEMCIDSYARNETQWFDLRY